MIYPSARCSVFSLLHSWISLGMPGRLRCFWLWCSSSGQVLFIFVLPPCDILRPTKFKPFLCDWGMRHGGSLGLCHTLGWRFCLASSVLRPCFFCEFSANKSWARQWDSIAGLRTWKAVWMLRNERRWIQQKARPLTVQKDVATKWHWTDKNWNIYLT